MNSKMMLRLVAAAALSAFAAAGCVMTPTTATEILNACTDAETGEASKDAPYFPSLAFGGVLPALEARYRAGATG